MIPSSTERAYFAFVQPVKQPSMSSCGKSSQMDTQFFEPRGIFAFSSTYSSARLERAWPISCGRTVSGWFSLMLKTFMNDELLIDVDSFFITMM